MRFSKLLRLVLGLGRAVVITGWDLDVGDGTRRPRLTVALRRRAHKAGRCGRCQAISPWYDRGGGKRRWRHLDLGFATCELVADAPRVSCPVHGVTVAAVSWARHDSTFTRAFEDLVVHDAITGNKQAAATRYGISWRAVNNACARVAAEALAQTDLLDGLIAIAIDEVKYKKGQRYLTIVSDHFTGNVIWAAKGRTKKTVHAFFDALGPERAAELGFVTCDGAEWIRAVLTERVPDAVVCIDTFHVISWATDALDEVRRDQWNQLRTGGGAAAAKAVKGLRFLLLRNWENLRGGQKTVIRELARANGRLFRAWQLKEELRDIFSMPLRAARVALDTWLIYASRSQLPSFVKLARSIRHYRDSIEATIEWRLTNGLAESTNASIGRIRANARGFHDPDAFITMILLDRGGLAPALPWQQAA